MKATPLNPRPRWAQRAGRLIPSWWSCCAFLLLIAGFSEIFYQYANYEWTEKVLAGAYTHAYLALPVFFWLMWRAFERARPLDPTTAGWIAGLSLIALGAMAKIHGEIQDYTVLRGMTLIPLLLGILLTRYGFRSVQGFVFPVLFLLFVIPLPGFILDQLTAPLRWGQAGAAATTLGLVGLPVTHSGFSVQLLTEQGTILRELFITEGCSGVRSVVALGAVGTLYIHLQDLPPVRKLLLYVLVVPLAMVGNFIRILIASVLAFNFSTETAEGFFHQGSGLLVFVVTVASLLVAVQLARRATSPEAANV